MDDAPKPAPPASPQGLAEVERAVSVLQGRHPEHERYRREDEARRAARNATLDAASRAETHRIHRRRALIAAAVAGVVLVVAAIALLVVRAAERRARRERAKAPYPSFAIVETESSSASLSATLPAGCALVVSSASAEVRLQHPGGELRGPSPLFACFCESADVRASSSRADDELVLLRADARDVGGSKAVAALAFAPGAVGATDAPCAEASFDAWLDARSWRSPSSASDAVPPASVPATFRLLARAKGPLSVVDVPAESCVLVRGPAALRVRGGSSPVPTGAGDAGWCTRTGAILTLRDADATVYVAPAARVGGLRGLTEIATVARVATTDHGWDAKAFLVASAIPATLVTAANAPDLVADADADADARIVAISSDIEGTLAPETADGVWSFCAPGLCVFSGPQTWRLSGTSEGGIARAKLPFWLFGLDGVSEPGAMKVAVQLLGLARRLRRDGFEPTTIEALTETERGVEILGRAHEDAVVAVTLLRTAPWLVPYTDGAPWSLEGEPRIVPLAPLHRILLAPPTAGSLAFRSKLPPRAARHTVVFRRASASASD